VTPDQISTLETTVEKQPGVFDTRLKLFIIYYAEPTDSPRPTIRLSLWHDANISSGSSETDPEDDLAGTPLLFITTAPPDPLADRQGMPRERRHGSNRRRFHREREKCSVMAAYFLHHRR